MNDLDRLRDEQNAKEHGAILTALEDVKRIIEKTHTQATKTNGRVTKIEVRHEEEISHNYPARISSLEQYKNRFIGSIVSMGAVSTIVITVLGVALNYSFKGVVREELIMYQEQQDLRLAQAIKDELENYEFNIIK